MLLRREHLSALRINWDSKALNLQAISAELQLSLDSFVFLDDEEFECESMRMVCPDVLTLQVPKGHPLKFPKCSESCGILTARS